MEFKKITVEEFRDYAAKSPYQSFMQTPEIAALREQNGWKSAYLAVKNGHGKILAATMLVSKPTFLRQYQTFYAPGGPLLDFMNSELTKFFFEHLQKYVYYHKGYVLHIDPYYELIERDRHGLPVDGGFNHEKALRTLQNLGFRAVTRTSMPKYLFTLDLNGQKPDALFKNFKQNTRNLTRRAERLGVRVRELKRDELQILKTITQETAERRGFEDQPLSYYEQMYDLFYPRGEIKFLLAEADTTDANPAENTASTPDNPAGANHSTTSATPDHSAASQNAANSAVSSQNVAPKNANSAPRPLTPLSTAMFMLVGHEVIYLYSGSDEAYMKKYNAQYLIQWHMIKFAAEHGFDRYNFYGIRGLPDPASKDYGIYCFKKGFGGHVIELIGSFELPIRPHIYRLHHLLSTIKGKITL